MLRYVHSVQLGALVNAREIASFILLAALVMAAMTKRENRRVLGHVARLFLDRRIVLVTWGYAVYVIVTVLVARALGLWDRHLLIETILWFVVSGYPLLLSVTDAAKVRGYFRKSAKSVFGVVVIFVFFINLVTFSLILGDTPASGALCTGRSVGDCQ